jgi:hypothetical protein
MDNGAVFRLLGLMLSSIHRVRYELHGDRGLIGTEDSQSVRIHHEDWLRQEDQPREMTYLPDWPAHGDLARSAGHGGGDFWTSYHFARAIRSGSPPYLDVYRGCAMAAVGIQGWRSCLEEGASFDVPDFSDEQQRARYEDDQWSPFPGDAGPDQPPPSLRGYMEPSEEAVRHAREVWEELGYAGD